MKKLRQYRISKKMVWSLVLLFFGVLFWYLYNWLPYKLGDMPFEQILYTLTTPLEGTSPSIILDFITSCLIYVVLIAALFYAFILQLQKKNLLSRLKTNLILVLCICIFCSGTYAVLNRIGIDGYVYSRISPSNFLEENYVSKEADDFSFPSEKRNLIYIFMESMEQTYADTEHGGYFEESLIPNLQQLQQEGVTFSDDGYVCSKAASWTVASLVGQTSASPLKTNLLHLNADEMLPGALGIGEVLEEGGYNQVFLLGSPSTFSKRDLYFSQHGNYQIEDYNYAKEQGWIDEDYKVWWGYEDDKLFEFAKLEATRLASSNEPFNLTMLTADTHFYGGYLCEDCPEADTQLESVIRCSDAKVSAFVRWCMEQDWYENTTIVLVGDHVSMDNSWFSDNGASSFNRKVYYTFLNPAQDVTDQSERIFNAYDMFPTTLSALNITWDDDQIGLGTNLFSGEQTLCEIYGAKSLDKKILDCSLWYDKNILN